MPPDDPLAKLIDRAAASDAPPEVRSWFRSLAAGESASSGDRPAPPPQPCDEGDERLSANGIVAIGSRRGTSVKKCGAKQ